MGKKQPPTCGDDPASAKTLRSDAVLDAMEKAPPDAPVPRWPITQVRFYEDADWASKRTVVLKGNPTWSVAERSWGLIFTKTATGEEFDVHWPSIQWVAREPVARDVG